MGTLQVGLDGLGRRARQPLTPPEATNAECISGPQVRSNEWRAAGTAESAPRSGPELDLRALLVGLGDGRCLGGRVGRVLIVAVARLVVGQERVELGVVALAACDRGRQGKPRGLVRRASRTVLEERVVLSAAFLDRLTG